MLAALLTGAGAAGYWNGLTSLLAVSVVVVQIVVLGLIRGRRRTGSLAASAYVFGLAVLLVLGAGMAGGALGAVGLLAALGLFGVGETLFQPSIMALVNDLAPDAGRGRYNSVINLSFQAGAGLCRTILRSPVYSLKEGQSRTAKGTGRREVTGMLMTDQEVRKAINAGELVIDGFDEACLQPASYDARIGPEVYVSHCEDAVVFDDKTRTVALQPGEFALLVTHERFALPKDIAGNIGAKTYFTHKGLILLAGLQIDPGFKGALALAVFNSSPKAIVLEYLQEICTIQFFRLSMPVSKVPPVNRDLEAGRLPRVGKDYFRELETQSLTQIAKELKGLAMNMGQLAQHVDALTKNVSGLEKNMAALQRAAWALLSSVVLAILAVAYKIVTG
ncbi:MAG: dCTP deaminase [Bacillota bacterium]